VPKSGQSALFEVIRFSYYVVVTNREGEVREVLELHDKRGMSERRIAQFTNEFLFHLPMEWFMSNWVYLLCAQLAYNMSLWIRDLVLPPFYRKKHIKRIRRTIGLIASKVTHGGHQVRLSSDRAIPIFGRGNEENLRCIRKRPNLAEKEPQAMPKTSNAAAQGTFSGN